MKYMKVTFDQEAKQMLHNINMYFCDPLNIL